MKYSTIRIEGSILSADILDKLSREELSGQSSSDFGLAANRKVKDEIARTWADAQDMWRVYNRRIERLAENDYGTSETRKFWIIPLLEMLGFDAVFAKSETVNGNSYAISHRVNNLDQFPIHIMGLKDSLDKKRSDSGPRMSPHGLVQEYLNLTEHLYAIVANGNYLRLLRDSSRLIKLSFIEFDLASMMDDEHFADFAIMYRLLHASRMPHKLDLGADSLIEKYHQDALDSGSRIRAGLSKAVEASIKQLGNGFLAHPDNTELRSLLSENKLTEDDLYEYLLKLIYRLLFLMVIEERDLVYPKGCNKEKRQIYYSYYSVASLRRISEKPYLADQRFNDLWINLKNCFALFDKGGKGELLDLKPLAGDLFGSDAIGVLDRCSLDNKTLLTCLRNLNIFENPVTRQKMRVNYGSLNVEEFGSVYEGLLEKDPVLQIQQGQFSFSFKAGDERSSSGSHYTPDELVQPLIKHSLDHIIEEKLKSSDPIASLLSIKVCDVACGSGHILLNAARRIGGEIAKLRSGEEQPSPGPFRQGVRDAISHCIYGVDKNPLAVELCKVALWLEAHDPGKPLSFLDHHIKCGDAIVGLAHKEELENGIAIEAFKMLAGDDKDVAKRLREKNKTQIKKEIIDSKYIEVLDKPLVKLAGQCREVHQIDQQTSDDVELVKTVYQDMVSSEDWMKLKTLADIQVAQFFISKIEENEAFFITHLEYKDLLEERKILKGPDVDKARKIGSKNRFFHWFLEFPEVFENGGFDCILGNPPYLGGGKISTYLGNDFNAYLKSYFSPSQGQVDLLVYFIRRMSQLLNSTGVNGIIGTKTVSEGDSRVAGLQYLTDAGFKINFAYTVMKWPGAAAVFVSLFGFTQNTKIPAVLNGVNVKEINSSFSDEATYSEPKPLMRNANQCFKGSEPVGAGFLLTHDEAEKLSRTFYLEKEAIIPFLIGDDINSSPSLQPSRCCIYFSTLTLEQAQKKFPNLLGIIKERVYPKRSINKDKRRREIWWQFSRPTADLYKKIVNLQSTFVINRHSKYLAIGAVSSKFIYSDATVVIAKNNWSMFAIYSSNIHEIWAWFRGSTMGSAGLRYTPSSVFATFPAPLINDQQMDHTIQDIGKSYYKIRCQVMGQLQFGLTKIYNLFHNLELTTTNLTQVIKKNEANAAQAYEDILNLRKLHKEMDNAVLKAYGWSDIDLSHDFYDMEYLPENDRTRYTISPDARKEILKRLLQLNHDLYAEEVAQGLHDKKKKAASKKIEAALKKGQSVPGKLF